MILHQNQENFKKAIVVTAAEMGIETIYVEKDYWVTYALHTIFHNEIGNDTVFKGGTALSKCYSMIDRFSEDIDLVVLRREGDSDNKLKNKLKTISQVVSEVLPEVVIDDITKKMGMNRKTAHTYNKEFSGNYGQVRDVIILEATWLGYHEPFTNRPMQSFVGQMMLTNGQASIAEVNGLMPFEVRVLDPTRTLCEKIMSLVRFSYGENPIEDLRKKIRHTYDLHQLLQQTAFSEFLHSPDFDEMLLKVGNDDVRSFKNNNEWLVNHPSEALIFKDLANVWQLLRPVYNGDFRNLVYGTLPNPDAVLATLTEIKQRLQTTTWSIIIEK